MKTTFLMGDLLYTKDGRVIGNATIISEEFIRFKKIGRKKVYTVRTDSGNDVKLTATELNGLFYFSRDKETVFKEKRSYNPEE